MISVKKLHHFDLEDVPKSVPSDLPLIPSTPRPSYILLTSHYQFLGQTIITGSVPSYIFFAIMLREENFRGELRRSSSKKDWNNFCTFASFLCPFVIMQLLYLFGYRVVSMMDPPKSAFGQYRKVWTLQSGFPFHKTKTYIAVLKFLANNGYDVASEGRLWGRPTPPWLEMFLANAENHKQIVDYILLRSRRLFTPQGDMAGELFSETTASVRAVLRKKSDELNEQTRKWKIYWYTILGRKELWDAIMVPFEAMIPLRCLLPGMGEARNVLIYYRKEWYEAGSDEIHYIKDLPEQKELIAKAVKMAKESSPAFSEYGKSVLDQQKKNYLGLEHPVAEETKHPLMADIYADKDDDDTEDAPEGMEHIEDSGTHYQLKKQTEEIPNKKQKKKITTRFLTPVGKILVMIHSPKEKKKSPHSRIGVQEKKKTIRFPAKHLKEKSSKQVKKKVTVKKSKENKKHRRKLLLKSTKTTSQESSDKASSTSDTSKRSTKSWLSKRVQVWNREFRRKRFNDSEPASTQPSTAESSGSIITDRDSSPATTERSETREGEPKKETILEHSQINRKGNI